MSTYEEWRDPHTGEILHRPIGSPTEYHDPGDEDRRADDRAARRREYMRAHGLDVFSSVSPEILAEHDLALSPEEIEEALAASRRDREAVERMGWPVWRRR